MKNSDTNSFFPITEERSRVNSSADSDAPATSAHALSKARTPARAIPSDTTPFFPITEARTRANSSADSDIPGTSAHALSKARTPALAIPSDTNNKSQAFSLFESKSLAHSLLKPPSPIARELAIEKARAYGEGLHEINPLFQSNASGLAHMASTVDEATSKQSQSLFQHSKNCITQALNEHEKLKSLPPCSADEESSDSELMFACDV